MEEMLFPLCNALTDNCAISLFFRLIIGHQKMMLTSTVNYFLWYSGYSYYGYVWIKKIHNHDASYVFYFCRAHCVHTCMNHQRLVVQSFYFMQCPVQSEIVICSAFTRSLNRYFCEYNYHQNKQKYNLVTKNNEQDKIPGNMYR